MFNHVNAQYEESFEGFMSGIRANALSGRVIYQRGEGKFDLEPGIKLEQDDFVRTGSDGYAELLLQPGNYLRVGNNSECHIVSEQHDKMRLKLNQGAISIEILARDFSSFFYSHDQANQPIRISTADAEVIVTRPGIFRINTSPGRGTEVIARDGEVMMNGRRIKEKRRAVVENRSVAIEEIDSKIEDAFDVWARDCAEKAVKANKSLKRESLWTQNVKQPNNVTVEAPDEESKDNRGRVISAKPGAINFVDAGVEFTHDTGKWEPLTEKSELATGDTLRTNASNFVELNLLPDMYLRLDGSSEVVFKELSNDAVSLKLLRGSVILDVSRFDRKQATKITVGGSSTSAVIDSEGNYRIDVRPDGDTITVREGKVIVNERSVGSCRRINGGTVSDCDKKLYDNFDFWSHHRGEGQSYNGRVTMATATYLGQVRRNRFRNTGFWFQQPGQTTYMFVPFTSRLLKSPYGGSYSTVLSARPSMNRTIMGRGPTFELGPQKAPPRP